MTMSFENTSVNEMSNEELIKKYGATREELENSGELTPEGEEDDATGEEEGGEESTSEEGKAQFPDSLVPVGKPLEPGPDPGAMQPGETQGDAITRHLLSGKTREELVAMNFNPNTVRTIYSQLKTTGKIKAEKRPPPGAAKKKDASESSMTGMQVFAKGSPPEAIISSIKIPDVTDGQGVSFEQGMKFGMSVVILGVRVAQELSGIGITQAKPILDMAKSMREGEALAAQNAAGDAAMEAAGMVRDSMMPFLTNLSRSGGVEGGDPIRKMMVDTMQPIIQRLMGSTLGRLLPGTQPPQLTQGQGGVEGWSERSE